MAALRTQNTASGTGTITCQLTGVQVGDLLIACIEERDGTAINSIGDDVNGAHTQAVTRAATAARAAIYFFRNSAAGNPTLTVDIAGSGPRDVNFSAWSGMETGAGALDDTDLAGNTSATSHSPGTVVPSAQALIITVIGFGAAHGGITPGAGFTALNVDGGAASQKQHYAYKLAHTGSITPAHGSTNAVSSDAVVAAFLEAAGGGSSLNVAPMPFPRTTIFPI